MNPGKMDRRVVIQERSMVQDPAGGIVKVWSDAFKCWAEIITRRASESISADADRAQDVLQFRIRYKAGITSGNHRLFYQLKFYNIEGIEESGRRDSMVLTCRALQSLTHI